ncbi:hypothetical protein [Yersinia enterocolitica]|uniref:hypothetical protein n=1 Tax=Yersinia enterocolitica TaxID=630 RepID=UPI001C60EBA5|nr:hypothetical protein [Yersinia enterocolitica]MBW5852517.1 hypothetical protein [Yersinia enterocolitica]
MIKLAQDYYDLFFIKSELEDCLGFSLDMPNESDSVSDCTELRSVSNNDIVDSLKIENEQLKNECDSLRKEVDKLMQERPIHLGKYRNDDPLLLAIEIRNREWVRYDPDNDRATRGNQAAIKSDLEARGFTSRQAESIELVACPIRRNVNSSSY